MRRKGGHDDFTPEQVVFLGPLPRYMLNKDDDVDVGGEPKVSIIRGSDGKGIVVTKNVAFVSPVIKTMVQKRQPQPHNNRIYIDLPKYREPILQRVIEYCQAHAETTDAGILKHFDADYVKRHQTWLAHINWAADGLGIRSLVKLVVDTVLVLQQGKTAYELAQLLGLA